MMMTMKMTKMMTMMMTMLTKMKRGFISWRDHGCDYDDNDYDCDQDNGDNDEDVEDDGKINAGCGSLQQNCQC